MYRPVIAFSPVIALLLALAVLLCAMATILPWMKAGAAPLTKGGGAGEGEGGWRPEEGDIRSARPPDSAEAAEAAAATPEKEGDAGRGGVGESEGAPAALSPTSQEGQGWARAPSGVSERSPAAVSLFTGPASDPSGQVVLSMPPCGIDGERNGEGTTGSLLSVHPHRVTRGLRFDAISVSVASSTWAAVLGPASRRRSILEGVSCEAMCGELLGLLGPSGSGKSTLINVLTGQIQSGGRWKVRGRCRVCWRQVEGEGKVQVQRGCIRDAGR